MPEGESLAESGGCVCGVPGGQRLPPVGDLIVEAVEIELARLDPQLVGVGAGDQHGIAQEAPQLRDVVVENLRRARRARLAPELIDQSIGGDRLVGVENVGEPEAPAAYRSR